MAYGKKITYKKEDNIGIITLNQPKTFNLTGTAFYQELWEIQDEIERDAELRAVVLKGEGKYFCAGIDVKELKGRTLQHVMAKIEWQQRLYGRWQEFAVPVIAALHGVCFGSGLEMVLGCDIRIATEDCRFSLPEVRMGFAPDMGGTVRLTKLVGMGQAKRILLGCEEIRGREAFQIGLVEIVTSQEELLPRAMGMAETIAALPPVAVRFAKKGVNLAQESSMAAGLQFEQAQYMMCLGTEDKKEASLAFLEKRAGVFKNR